MLLLIQFYYWWLVCLRRLHLRICPFLLGCLFYWCIVTISSLLWSFVFLWYLVCKLSFLISDIIDLGPLPFFLGCCCHSVAKSYPTLCNPINYTSSPCPSLSPGICTNSSPLSRWCYPIISSSAALFSFRLQSFPLSGSFPMSGLFTSGGQVLDLQLQHLSLQWIFRVDFL